MPVPSTSDPDDITAHLLALRTGGRPEMDALFAAVYGRLHRLARSRLRGARSATLDATTLVHEVFLRFVDGDKADYQDRRHFFATAARAMRQIVVDHARRRATAKRGGDMALTTLSDSSARTAISMEDVLAVDRALEDLARMDARLVTVIELCFFAGMTTEEAADVLDISARTVKRDWQRAKMLLMALLGRRPGA